jgi:hypothetical protein
MRRLISRGLEATASLWPDIRRVFARVHEAAAILDNPTGDSGETVRSRYEALLERLRAEVTEVPALAPAMAHFLKVTQSYWPGLFHCYDVPGLPRTNNDLEQFFGAVRYQERRACGRKVASPTLVLRGAVRVVAAVATRMQVFPPEQLVPRDLDVWRALRARLAQRRTARVQRYRFRRNPQAYLRDLEGRLLKLSLPP